MVSALPLHAAAYPAYPSVGTPVEWVNPLAEDVADDITSDYLTFKEAFKMLGEFLNGLFEDVKTDNQARYAEMKTSLGSDFLKQCADRYGIYSKEYYSAIQLNLNLLGYYPEDILLYMNVEKDKAEKAKETAADLTIEGNLTGSVMLNTSTGTEFDNFSLWYRQNVSYDGEKFTVREKVLNPLNYTFMYKNHSFTDLEDIYTYVPAAYKTYFKALFDDTNADMSKAKMDYLLGIGKVSLSSSDKAWSEYSINMNVSQALENPANLLTMSDFQSFENIVIWYRVIGSDGLFEISYVPQSYDVKYDSTLGYVNAKRNLIDAIDHTIYITRFYGNVNNSNNLTQPFYKSSQSLTNEKYVSSTNVIYSKKDIYDTLGNLWYSSDEGIAGNNTFTYQPTIPVYDIRTQGMSFANVGSPVDVPIEEDENDNIIVPPGTLPGLPDEVGDPSIPDTSLWPLNDILTGLNTGVQNIADRLDESTTLGRIIAESMAYDEDSERRGRMLDVSLPNFLLLLLLILINILYLIMKALVVATKILQVQASTVLFNDDVVAAIERTKDLTIGGFNLSIYDMLSWLVIFVFTFAIVGVLRKYLDGMKV